MNPPDNAPAFFRPAQAAIHASVSRRTVNNWTRTGILPVIRVGKRCTLIARADLDAMLFKCRTGRVTP